MNLLLSAGSLVVVLLILGSVFFLLPKTDKKKNQQSNGTGSVPSQQQQQQQQQVKKTTTSTTTTEEAGIRTNPPEIKIADFAFERLDKPGFVPNEEAVMVQKPAGNPPYKLTACNVANGYAVRWNGKYLSMETGDKFKWADNKSEPDSCFRIVSGYCKEGYVMLRSAMNNQFLRVDEASGALVCKDGPTGRTSSQYCWKFSNNAPVKQPCGAQYSYDLGRVVNIPCDLKKTPDAGQSCTTVTKGFISNCCIGKPGDSGCASVIFPQVVGRTLQEALLYIRSRRPDLTLRPCPEPCTLTTFPEPDERVVVIPYDARSNYVTSPAYRLM